MNEWLGQASQTFQHENVLTSCFRTSCDNFTENERETIAFNLYVFASKILHLHVFARRDSIVCCFLSIAYLEQHIQPPPQSITFPWNHRLEGPVDTKGSQPVQGGMPQPNRCRELAKTNPTQSSSMVNSSRNAFEQTSFPKRWQSGSIKVNRVTCVCGRVGRFGSMLGGGG